MVLLVTTSYLMIYLLGWYGLKFFEFILNKQIDLNNRFVGVALMFLTAFSASFYIHAMHPLSPDLNSYEASRIQGQLMGEFVIEPLILALSVISLHWWYQKKVNYQ